MEGFEHYTFIPAIVMEVVDAHMFLGVGSVVVITLAFMLSPSRVLQHLRIDLWCSIQHHEWESKLDIEECNGLPEEWRYSEPGRWSP